MVAVKKGGLQGVFKAPKPAQREKPNAEIGKTRVIFRMSEDGKKQIDFLAVELGRTKQNLLCEAVNDFLEKHGKQRTA